MATQVAKVGTLDEWKTARIELLKEEKEWTRQADALAEKRRKLPLVRVEKDYKFSDPETGKQLSLADLFDGRRQLVVYHLMFAPEKEEVCIGCSFFVDNMLPAAHLVHLHSRDTSFVVVSRSPIAKIQAFKARMGWTLPWYSSEGSDFNYDFHVSFDPDRKEGPRPEYNFKETDASGELPGLSSFYRDLATSDVLHSYSTYARGTDHMSITHSILDVTALGRQDGDRGAMAYRHHDKYAKNEAI